MTNKFDRYSFKKVSDTLAEVIIHGKPTKWLIRRDGTLFSTRGEAPTRCHKYAKDYVTNKIKRHNTTRHHLVALAFVVNPRPDLFDRIDHKDGNKLNNHAENLRFVTHQLNLLNIKSKVRLPLMNQIKKTYRAELRIRVDGRQRHFHLGVYDSGEEALKVMTLTRKSAFAALYHYHTRPNTFYPPDLWVVSPGKIRVRPSFES